MFTEIIIEGTVASLFGQISKLKQFEIIPKLRVS